MNWVLENTQPLWHRSTTNLRVVSQVNMQTETSGLSRPRLRSFGSLAGAALAAFVWLLSGPVHGQTIPAGLSQIEHIIIIYQENRSFDFLLGDFPGANGIPANPPRQLQFSNDPNAPYSDGPAKNKRNDVDENGNEQQRDREVNQHRMNARRPFG